MTQKNGWESFIDPLLGKKNSLFSPIHILFAAVLFAVIFGLAVIHIATERPWIGVTFSYDKSAGGAVVYSPKGPSAHIPAGTVVTNIASETDNLDLIELDFVPEPDGGMGTYKTYYEFLKRQDRLAKIQNSTEVILKDKNGQEWNIKPLAERPLFSLPVEFWIQFVVGIMAWFISVSVWALRPNQDGTRYLLLNGFGMIISAQLAAPYTTRELAIPAQLFWWIDGLNFFGGSLFAASLAALLLYYPRKLAPRWVGWIIIAFNVIWYILQDQDVVESMTDARRILVMVSILGSFVLGGVHWVKTRKDPVARASLQYFLLSWVLATGIFSSMLFIPQLFGIDTSSLQSYGFTLFLLMYVGLSFGILKFRLFGLGEWWYRIVFWVSSMLLLVVFDLVFLFGLNLSNKVSLSAALLICGVFWFPLRGFLQSRFIGRPVSGTAKFKHIVDVALAPQGSYRTKAYLDLLKDFFKPLNIQMLSDSSSKLELLNHGQAMVIPSIVGLPPYRLEFAAEAQRLFSPKDLNSVRELSDMLQYTVESQDSYKKGVTEERYRIAQDLHDDVGARLLSGLHTPESNLRKTIQEALIEIRSIVSGISGEKVPLSHFLADLRHETYTRCQTVGIELQWPIHEDTIYERQFDYRIYKNLGSSIREVVSNVIKHSGAKLLSIEILADDKKISLKFSDNGCGISEKPASGTKSGNGFNILNKRIESLKGTFFVRSGSFGTEVLISIPWEV